MLILLALAVAGMAYAALAPSGAISTAQAKTTPVNSPVATGTAAATPATGTPVTSPANQTGVSEISLNDATSAIAASGKKHRHKK
jgi:hypothetical protein